MTTWLLWALVAATPVPEWHALDATTTTILADEHVDKEMWAVLRQGEVVTQRRPLPDDKTGARVAAFAVLHASPEEVFTVISDCERLPEFMPNFDRCTYVEPDEPLPPNERWARQELTFGFRPMRVSISMVQHNELFPPHRLTWRRVSGDTRYNEGYWHIVTVADGVQFLIYDLLVDAGRAVPGWLQRVLTERDLPDVVDVVRERVEQGHGRQ